MDASSVPPLADPLAPLDGDAASHESEVKVEPTPLGEMTGQMPVHEQPINMTPLPVNVPQANTQQHRPPVPGHPHVQDVAMSLVSLGRTEEEAAAHAAGVPIPELPPVPPNENNNGATIANVHAPEEEANEKPMIAPIATTKYNMKPRDPKRDTSIPFEEMQRLMRVYGPIKCLRNRTPKESGKDLKQESIKRKFYRWFPDFCSRFERTPEGWYKPRYGHDEEMQYRAGMRKKDQDELVKKRNNKRTSRKAKEKGDVEQALPEVAPELPAPPHEVAEAPQVVIPNVDVAAPQVVIPNTATVAPQAEI